jgi:uncharacterized protein YqeY
MIKEKIASDHMAAFKARNKARAAVLSVLKGEITTAEKSGKEMDDAEVTKLLVKVKNGLQESLSLREDPAIRQELEVVESYLPKAMDREEIHYQCRQIMAGMPKELPDAARIGKTMGEFNKRFPGQTDPKEVMNIIKML